MTAPIKTSTLTTFNRTPRARKCECGRPGCPVDFVTKKGGLYATPECKQYTRIQRRIGLTAQPTNPRIRMPETERVKLPGDHYRISCGRYTAHKNNRCACGRERGRACAPAAPLTQPYPPAALKSARQNNRRLGTISRQNMESK